MNDNTKFEMHCIIEIFGHTKIAGKVSEQTIAGQGFIRVDVPKTSKRDGFTRFYGPNAIYAMTPVSEQVAALMAERLEVEAVSEWTLRQAIQDLLPTTAGGNDGNDDRIEIAFEGDEESWADDFDEDDEEENTGNVVHFDVEPHYQEAKNMLLGIKSAPAVPEKAVEDVQEDFDKRAAAQWARDLLAGEFVIFDTETTGFDTDDEIIQIGVIDQTGAVVLEQLVKPVKTVANSQYHGITNEMLADAPGFPEVYERIKTALDGKVIVAYNFAYDSRMLNQVCRKHGLDAILWFTEHCAMEKYAAFNGDWNDYHGNYRWVKLREAIGAFGLKHTDFGTKEHDACTDARATLALIKKMAAFEAEKSAAAE